MNPPVVAVIDDGIAVHDCIPDPVMNIEINDDGSVSESIPAFSFSHSTICADIIRAQTPDVKKDLIFRIFQHPVKKVDAGNE
jgi:hypothetical protein